MYSNRLLSPCFFVLEFWNDQNNNAIKNDKIEQINEWDERPQHYGWILHKILDIKVRLGKAIGGVIPAEPGPKSDHSEFETRSDLSDQRSDRQKIDIYEHLRAMLITIVMSD